jgi:hypothetical protein
MGSRAQIKIKMYNNNRQDAVYLYTHWGSSKLK